MHGRHRLNIINYVTIVLGALTLVLCYLLINASSIYKDQIQILPTIIETDDKMSDSLKNYHLAEIERKKPIIEKDIKTYKQVLSWLFSLFAVSLLVNMLLRYLHRTAKNTSDIS